MARRPAGRVRRGGWHTYRKADEQGHSVGDDGATNEHTEPARAGDHSTRNPYPPPAGPSTAATGPALPTPTLPTPAPTPSPQVVPDLPHPPHVPAPIPPPQRSRSHRSGARSAIASVAVLLAAVAVLLAAVGAFAANRHEGTSFGIGTAIGAVFIIGSIAWVVARRGSTTAGIVTAIVIGLVVFFGNAARIAERNDDLRQIEEAFASEGLPTGDSTRLTDDEATCFEESDFEPDDVVAAYTDTGVAGRELQAQLFAVTARCAPRIATSASNVETLRLTMSNSFPGEITTVEAGCMLDGMVEHPSPGAVLGGDDPDALVALAEECLLPTTFDAFIGASGAGPQEFGDDPMLDAVADRCRGGSDAACDVLYATSSVGSAYQTLGEDCAGRGLEADALFCTPGLLDNDADGFADDDSPGWAAVFSECRAGEMITCDLAFNASELGSEAERVGETCGERRALSNGESCFERFPDPDV